MTKKVSEKFLVGVAKTLTPMDSEGSILSDEPLDQMTITLMKDLKVGPKEALEMTRTLKMDTLNLDDIISITSGKSISAKKRHVVNMAMIKGKKIKA